MHFLKSNKTITKPVLFLALLLSLTTIIGCNSKAVTDAPTKIEISNEEETLSSNEVSENSVVSENTVVSEDIVEEEGPVFTESLTEEEIAEIGDPLFEKLTNNPPIDGIFNPDYDFSKCDSIYKNDKNYQREYLSALNIACMDAAYIISTKENKEYVGVVSEKNLSILAAIETLSIITLNDNLEKYYIIKDYKGEDVILKDSYLDFCTGNKLEDDITNFNVTSMNDYLGKYYDSSYIRGPGYIYNIDYTDFANIQYKNIGKTK